MNSTGKSSFFNYLHESPYLCSIYLLLTTIFSVCCIFVLTGIYRSKISHTSGYMLLASLVVAENFCLIVWHFGGTLPITLHYYDLLEAPGYTYETGLWVGYFQSIGYFATTFHYVALGFQRYHTAKHLHEIDAVSSKKKIGILIFVIWFVSTVKPLDCFLSECQYYFSVETYGPTFNFDGNISTFIYLIFGNYVYNVSIIGLVSVLFIKTRRKIKQFKSQNIYLSNNVVAKVEIRLCIHMSILASFLVIIYVLWFIINLVIPNVSISVELGKVVNTAMVLCTTLAFGIDTPLLLIMTDELRRSAFGNNNVSTTGNTGSVGSNHVVIPGQPDI